MPTNPTDNPFAPGACSVPQGGVLVISGPSGVGKTTITHAVKDAIPNAVFSVSCTTRAKTDADREGVDYFFISDERFDQMIDAGDFLEWAPVFDKKYGTPKQWVLSQLANGKLVILEIDVAGAESIRSTIPDMLGLFVLPPSDDALLTRLRNRKREPEDVIQRRFSEAKREIERAKSTDTYNHFIVNDNLENAIAEAVKRTNTYLATRA